MITASCRSNNSCFPDNIHIYKHIHMKVSPCRQGHEQLLKKENKASEVL